MTERSNHKSQLELKVEKFFEYDSELSDSDESLERTRSSSQPKHNKKHRNEKNTTHSQKRTAKKPTLREISQLDSTARTREFKSKDGVSILEDRDSFRMTSRRATEIPSNVSTLKDNYSLRMKISELSKTLSKKNQQIRKLYDDIYAEKEEIRQLTLTVDALSRKNMQIEEVNSKQHFLQQRELQLMQELSSQQIITKNALAKLQELQEASLKEVENAKIYYKEFYSQQTEEVKEQLENRIDLVIKEKDALVSAIKNIGAAKDLENTKQLNLLNQEILDLKEKLADAQDEVQRVKIENQDLKIKLREQEDSNTIEKDTLKAKIEELVKQSRVFRSQEDEYHLRDTKEKEKLYEKIDSLENELVQKNKSIVSRDKEYKEQLELINSKLEAFQKEVRKVGEYEMKIETLQKELLVKENELELAKQYYREKLAENKKAQSQQKLEWSTIYSEMLEEIKNLKSEMDLLEVENKKLLASLTSHPRNF